MRILQDRNVGSKIVSEYLHYKRHVCREVLEDTKRWSQKEQDVVREAWPEYANSVDLVSKRSYLSSDMDEKQWRDNYLAHVQIVQEKKQNHVHLINAKGESVPLAHCQRPDDPTK